MLVQALVCNFNKWSSSDDALALVAFVYPRKKNANKEIATPSSAHLWMIIGTSLYKLPAWYTHLISLAQAHLVQPCIIKIQPIFKSLVQSKCWLKNLLRTLKHACTKGLNLHVWMESPVTKRILIHSTNFFIHFFTFWKSSSMFVFRYIDILPKGAWDHNYEIRNYCITLPTQLTSFGMKQSITSHRIVKLVIRSIYQCHLNKGLFNFWPEPL